MFCIITIRKQHRKLLVKAEGSEITLIYECHPDVTLFHSFFSRVEIEVWSDVDLSVTRLNNQGMKNYYTVSNELPYRVCSGEGPCT